MMRFGLAGLQVGWGCEPEGLAGIVRLAENLGFESLWPPEHVVVPERVQSRYPFNAEGKLRNDPTVPRPDPLMWLAFAAAATSRIRLGTGVLLLPLRNPVLLAKETATLDRVSGGRLILGVGLGWMREEYDILASDWSDRGRRTEEYIGVLRTLWQPGPRSFSGPTVSFKDVHCSPTPLGKPIPIVVAGTSEAAARRAGRFGDGYFPMAVAHGRLRKLIGIAKTEAERVGRPPDQLEITYLGAPDPREIDTAAEAGADRYIVMDQTTDFAREPDRLVALAHSLALPADRQVTEALAADYEIWIICHPDPAQLSRSSW
jgi:probable F420-dependent oxidoreductase